MYTLDIIRSRVKLANREAMYKSPVVYLSPGLYSPPPVGPADPGHSAETGTNIRDTSEIYDKYTRSMYLKEIREIYKYQYISKYVRNMHMYYY